ncbi:MAG: hypothetical protein ACLP9L_06155 [Thermoguttaceae bacterium]
MGQARLTRIDAVGEMAAAVDAFRNEATAALESLDMEIRRALEWIHHDRHEHWEHQVRRGWERITEARVQLQQAMTARRIGEHDPACIDEKKALARAKQRLEIAQERIEAVRRCTRAIDHAVDEYRGARTPLSIWLESEAPKALAALRRMMDNLEDYLALNVAGDGSAGAIPSVNPANNAGETPALHDNTSVTPAPQSDAGETPALQNHIGETPAPPTASDGTAVNLGSNSPANQQRDVL